MTILKYTGTHQPQGMLIDVSQEDVENILKNESYEKTSDLDIPKKVETPNSKWKEIKIYDWIKENNIPIDYLPSRDTKDDVLKKLIKGGFINDNSI